MRRHGPTARCVGTTLSELDRAVEALARGGIVVVPTETVYGIAARADDAEAIDRIYALKTRPPEKALQLLVPNGSWIDRLARPSIQARELAGRFWPGPLTILVPGLGAQDVVGLRVPAHPVAQALLDRVGPLAATSANRSGDPTPSKIDAIRDLFGDGVDVYLDGGTIEGFASTVVDMSGDEPVIVREGAISAADVANALQSRFEAD